MNGQKGTVSVEDLMRAMDDLKDCCKHAAKSMHDNYDEDEVITLKWHLEDICTAVIIAIEAWEKVVV